MNHQPKMRSGRVLFLCQNPADEDSTAAAAATAKNEEGCRHLQDCQLGELHDDDDDDDDYDDDDVWLLLRLLLGMSVFVG